MARRPRARQRRADGGAQGPARGGDLARTPSHLDDFFHEETPAPATDARMARAGGGESSRARRSRRQHDDGDDAGDRAGLGRGGAARGGARHARRRRDHHRAHPHPHRELQGFAGLVPGSGFRSRPEGGGADPRAAFRALPRPTTSWARRSPTVPGSGMTWSGPSTRSTAPPTSSTASRCSADRWACSIVASRRRRPLVLHQPLPAPRGLPRAAGRDAAFRRPAGDATLNPRSIGGSAATQRLAPRGVPWDIRKTGSAAIECAFVAAGLLQVARFAQPNIWDIAGGIVLARAAGREVMVREAGGWKPFTSFAQPGFAQPGFAQHRLCTALRNRPRTMAARPPPAPRPAVRSCANGDGRSSGRSGGGCAGLRVVHLKARTII